MAIDNVSQKLVLNCRQRVRFRELGPVENYEHVAAFLRAFLIQKFRRVNVLLWKQAMLFLRDMV